MRHLVPQVGRNLESRLASCSQRSLWPVLFWAKTMVFALLPWLRSVKSVSSHLAHMGPPGQMPPNCFCECACWATRATRHHEVVLGSLGPACSVGGPRHCPAPCRSLLVCSLLTGEPQKPRLHVGRKEPLQWSPWGASPAPAQPGGQPLL